MAKYRQLYTKFWEDSFISELTPEEKYFYLYLLTNSKTSQCGIYELSKKAVEYYTGYNRDTVEKLLKRFMEYNKILYCDETNEIMIKNWVKYNPPNNTNAIKCVNKELFKVKNTSFFKVLYEECKRNFLDCENIFKGLYRGLQGAYEGTDSVIVENSVHSHESGSYQCVSDFDSDLIRGSEGDCKGLPSNRIRSKEEGVISNEQRVMSKEEVVRNNNRENEAAYAETDDADFSAVVKVFENNIHPITPLEHERLLHWSKDLSCNVIIRAIEEAVNYNARTMKYIDRILNCWLSKGIRTISGVNAYMRDWQENKKSSSKSEQGKNNFCDYEQRNYDFEELERQLLSLD